MDAVRKTLQLLLQVILVTVVYTVGTIYWIALNYPNYRAKTVQFYRGVKTFYADLQKMPKNTIIIFYSSIVTIIALVIIIPVTLSAANPTISICDAVSDVTYSEIEYFGATSDPAINLESKCERDKDKVFAKAMPHPVRGEGWALDYCATTIKREQYGVKSKYGVVYEYGWTIDHIIPVAEKAMGDEKEKKRLKRREKLSNLQPLHYKNNFEKNDKNQEVWNCHGALQNR